MFQGAYTKFKVKFVGLCSKPILSKLINYSSLVDYSGLTRWGLGVERDQAKKVCHWMHDIIDRLYTMLVTPLANFGVKIIEFIYVEEL